MLKSTVQRDKEKKGQPIWAGSFSLSKKSALEADFFM